MNYLGHAFLSGDNENILVGNMLGDFVKGNKFNAYPPEISQGLQYHRMIDTFTDSHEDVLAATKILREDGIRYASVFIDIFFDHFLANDQTIFPENKDLKVFTTNVLDSLSRSERIMTDEMKSYFGYMIRYNWLYHYHSKEGIEKSILGIIKRYPRLGNGPDVLFSLFNNMDLLRPHYHNFIKDITAWSEDTLYSIKSSF